MRPWQSGRRTHPAHGVPARGSPPDESGESAAGGSVTDARESVLIAGADSIAGSVGATDAVAAGSDSAGSAASPTSHGGGQAAGTLTQDDTCIRALLSIFATSNISLVSSSLCVRWIDTCVILHHCSPILP